MKRILMLIILSFLVFPIILLAYGQSEMGLICIAPISEPNEISKSLAVHKDGEKSSFKYSIQIDNGEVMELYFHQNIKYKELSLGKKHLIKIRLDGKIKESFWFTFKDYKDNNLCLWFSGVYETWSLWSQNQSGYICKCKDR